MDILPISFYQGRETATIARDLLGMVLVRESPAGMASGIIVETEAYLAMHDPASHSFRGPTKRNQAMYGPPGSSYVYISYGIHHCMNVVCQSEGVAEAVLIRSLLPLSGADLMRSRRRDVPERQLANGPGKVCQVMAIDLSLNGHPLQQAPLYILAGERPRYVEATPRIGISKGTELPLRFLARM